MYIHCVSSNVNRNWTLFLPQISKGYEFESETDTEVIPKLIKYVYDNRESDSVSFSTLVERVIQQLVRSSHTMKHILNQHSESCHARKTCQPSLQVCTLCYHSFVLDLASSCFPPSLTQVNFFVVVFCFSCALFLTKEYSTGLFHLESVKFLHLM